MCKGVVITAGSTGRNVAAQQSIIHCVGQIINAFQLSLNDELVIGPSESTIFDF